METILHLISEQTMQNVLPILALRPRKVIHVVSHLSEAGASPKVSKWAQRARWIEDAVRLAEDGAEAPLSVDWLEPVELGTPNPTVAEAHAVVAQLLRRHPGAVVNYTGGNKNMAIGAWTAATEAGCPRVYCDTPRSIDVVDPTGVVPAMSLRELSGRLSVPVMMASQGLRRDQQWSSGTVTAEQEEFGLVTHRMTMTHGKRFRNYRRQLCAHGLPGGFGRAKGADLERALAEPVPEPPEPAFRPILGAAVKADYLREEGGRYFYRFAPDGNRKARERQVERIAKAFSGIAFEHFVSAMLGRKGRYSDFLPNVAPAGRNPEEMGFGESDFLAYDPAGISLTLISCKSERPKLEHLESLLARKSKFGGLHAKTLLCVEWGGTDAEREGLRASCAALGIHCAIGEEVEEAVGGKLAERDAWA